jgi:hypothetical protein
VTKNQNEAAKNEAVVKRLDALIRLFIEMNKPNNKGKLNEGDAARLLRSVELTPTEIAKILGKKSATDVSAYLYPKKKRKPEDDAQIEDKSPAQKC